MTGSVGSAADTDTIGPAGAFEQAVVDQLYEGVYYVDLGRRIRYWNPGAERLSGYKPDDVLGRYCHDNLLGHVGEEGRLLCRDGCPLAATMRDGEGRETEVFLRHRSGHRVPVRVRASAIRDREGRIIGAVEVFDDRGDLVSARREASDLRELAMTDALTGIPNRRHFEMSIASRIAELAGYGREFGLLVADLDRFKALNDTHGHAVGDAALRTVARTMLASSRVFDDVARYGGEEFALTVVEVDAVELHSVGERMRLQVARSSVRTDAGDLGVTISIGGAVAVPGDTRASIFARADAALYQAKAAGRNRVVVDAGRTTNR